MAHVEPPDDPEDVRAARAKLIGVGLQTAGVFAGIAGLCLFGGVFLDSDPQPGVTAPAVGFALLLAAPGLWFAGKSKLPATDPAREPGPATGRPVVEVLPSGHDGPVTGPRLRHACGAWNEPGAAFCKQCGWAITGQACPSCLAWNDPDAHFCRGCGSPLVVPG